MNNLYPFINTPLPYSYDAMDPYIDTKTMWLHHNRHLQAYIDNLNMLLKNLPELQKWPLEKLLTEYHELPVELQTPIRNNAGGIYNHRFFFNELARQFPRKDIIAFYGSVEYFKTVFKRAALSVFGSGYVWLVSEGPIPRIITTANQDVPDLKTVHPLLNLDVWEHAYYLKHYNVRADYIEDWFRIVL